VIDAIVIAPARGRRRGLRARLGGEAEHGR
jgi:hypothetical protein